MENETDVKKLQEENQRLIHLYATKSDMVSIDIHQVRTSLSAIKWIIKMFLDGDLGTPTPEQKNLMLRAYESNDRAIQIASDLLVANKAEEAVEKPYVFEKVDIHALIESAMFDFSGEAYVKGIETIFLKPDEEVSLVRADKEKLRVVLQNILENAIKYSNMHAKVFITLIKKDDFCQVSVKDTGVGISEEGKKKIFEKFYRDSEAEKKEIIGSGMGLFTTKKIVEKHGGKIWFEARIKKVRHSFSQSPSLHRPIARSCDRSIIYGHMTKTILIIEDDNFLQELEAKKLKKEGYDILTAVNSKEAFVIINGETKLDLILLDLLLPDVDGFEILGKIRENPAYHNIPVIIFSNLSEEKDIKKARELGISEFLVKSNFTLDELAEKVKQLIGQ